MSINITTDRLITTIHSYLFTEEEHTYNNMAAIARFGFERGMVPNNVSIRSGSFVSGRNGGTAVESSAVGTEVGQVDVSTISTNTIYFSCQFKMAAANLNTSMSLVQFGNVWVEYEPANNRVTYRRAKAAAPGYDILYTSPSTVFFPVGTWVPMNGRFTIAASGQISTTIDGTSYISATVNTIGETTPSIDVIYFRLGNVNNYPKFLLDDVAVNNIYTGSNSTGSFGLLDANIPAYISAIAVEYLSTGSLTTGWTTPGGNLLPVVSGSGGTITASLFPRPKLQLRISSSLPITTVEGLNLFFGTASREGSSNVFISPSFDLNDTSSVGAYSAFSLGTLPTSNNFSIFEKDLGGKLTLSELNTGSVALNTSTFINKNFFGRGTLGDVRYTASANIGDSSVQGDYVVVEYNNLIVDSGATLTVDGTQRGLIIYVKNNCIVNGTISMSSTKSSSGSLSPGFIFDKNVNTSSFSEYSSSLHLAGTLIQEQIFQTFLSGQTTELGISGSFSAGGNAGAAGTGGASSGGPGGAGANGINRNPGGGGGGGGNSTSGVRGGAGGTSGTFGGGSGGGGGGNTSGQNGGDAVANAGAAGVSGGGGLGSGGRGGGVLYLIVGNTLFNNGTINANGANGGSTGNSQGGGGGGGGGSVNIFYGKNFINSGTVSANGGSAGVSTNNSGGAGGAGSVTITKILTN